jgi:hypothetical protein
MARTFAAASSQYLIAASAAVSAEPFSMACWFKPVNATTSQYTLMSFGTNGGTLRHMLVAGDTVNPVAVTFSVDGGGPASSVTTGQYTAGAWHHAGGVWASSASRIAYLNGVAATEDTTSKTVTMDRTLIGARINTTAGVFMDGDVAEAAIWGAALTAAEMASLADGIAPTAVRPDSLVGYWPLIGRASPEYDVVGGLAMTLTNTPTTGAHPRIYRPRLGRR